MKLRHIVLAVLLYMILSFMMSLARADTPKWDIDPYLEYQHISALFKGVPFNDRDELWVDSVNACLSVQRKTSRLSIALCEGYRVIEGGARKGENTTLSVRWHLRRR